MQAHNPQPDDRTDAIDSLTRALLRDVLGLTQDRVDAFDSDTPLFGALPELDSMAVAGLLTEMEDRFDILIDDDDIDGDTFETFGSLVAFARSKVAG
ncbi:phosphopantetheine-binding protein [Sphingobium sp.]|uniref:phosphopantetheine-binding protein n=1 Tax=Sphingobium sp. TaxID=1912891 RepID=UPI003BB7C2FF